MSTSDILDLNTMVWTEGPALPHDVKHPASVQLGNRFLLVGGQYEKRVLEFNQTNWIVRAEELDANRGYHVAMAVSPSYLGCEVTP